MREIEMTDLFWNASALLTRDIRAQYFRRTLLMRRRLGGKRLASEANAGDPATASMPHDTSD
jgi:hypothetical protein